MLSFEIWVEAIMTLCLSCFVCLKAKQQMCNTKVCYSPSSYSALPDPGFSSRAHGLLDVGQHFSRRLCTDNASQTLFVKQNISNKFTALYSWFCNGWGLAIFQDTLKVSFFLVLMQSICYHFKNKSNVFNHHTLLSPKFEHVSFAQGESY